MNKAHRNWKYALVFLAFAGVLIWCAVVGSELVVRLVLVNTAVAFGLVGAGYASGRPDLFFKRSDGRLPWGSWVCYWPYFAVQYLALFGFRVARWELPVHQVDNQIVLGCRLWQGDQLLLNQVDVVLDLTSEFSEVRFLRSKSVYRCVPLLDNTAPTLEQLQDGVRWIAHYTQTGKVYVHCALGHSRSALFVAAFWLLEKKAVSATDAIDKLREIRKGVRLTKSQFFVLQQFEHTLKAN
ncbi:MAG TPA: dual specificity protein phosphatase family protein [Acidobacteriota bacterium]|nr:dual specificity protein phosphatase family protein [Acidobacteriota bacterium]HNB74102.1 dual specificity protein phosphatase family protein [Acidobacteriota bacterium]HND20424.1 dual specificity protein phosphatase family protein [Acidobacteriota bacterium]HNG94019.1 dual specificity protein phosphatase family protein [Acidobacteriota bacterium]HNH82644.1 dual specificity protein phosphatase family protein [Acidobacteriota bacterium]